LKERIGTASIRELKLGRMDISRILQNVEDEDLKERIKRISEGNPEIAILALDYLREYLVKMQKRFFRAS
jgi:hypothetical protein